jgi:hypothetical protein
MAHAMLFGARFLGRKKTPFDFALDFVQKLKRGNIFRQLRPRIFGYGYPTQNEGGCVADFMRRGWRS